ncbi:MAG: UDP-N-acetylmuramoyl-L-alanyl-D-glutamate--2,6-diaminopimelate ligase [Gorillibacterium sp.]|nr:UDP-N-acetylmuramoyl-L-alanyl-D-glutamate--2,6-diaminopimelate ligase [Gorillibacterium sp.]
MRLMEIASLFPICELSADADVEITGIETDSRKVKPGYLFICVPGFTVDGHDYAAKAVENGAVALVVQRDLALKVPTINVQTLNVPTLKVKDCHYAAAVIGCHYYSYPSHELGVIGVTGTNGKTTTTTIIDHILRDQNKITGLMGTIRTVIGDQTYPTANTTQEPLTVQRYLRQMLDIGATYGIMEVSSHALHMGRVKGVHFRTALFTNLTQDHLDYHPTMEDYLAAKGLLFSRLDNGFHADPTRRQHAVLNVDDPASATLAGLTSVHIITYGIDQPADIGASNIRMTARGTEFRLCTYMGDVDVRLKLVGKFNVYNVLGAVAAVLLEGVPLKAIKNSLEKMSFVEGRMETVDEGQDYLLVVDYAHSPDSLENVLSTIREFTEGRVITVFGCGGDRDRSKRPLMGEIAGRYSDYIIATSDNPRTEEPAAILRDIEPGLLGFGAECYEMIVDRRLAIQKAVELAAPGDVILIAGKGHETYQEINHIRHPFDDRDEARKAIRSAWK